MIGQLRYGSPSRGVSAHNNTVWWSKKCKWGTRGYMWILESTQTWESCNSDPRGNFIMQKRCCDEFKFLVRTKDR